MRVWRGSDVSIGRELDTQDMFSLRIADLHMDPGSTLHAKIISETQVAATGSEPFVVALPTRELEVVVMCNSEIDVTLSPLYPARGGDVIPKQMLPSAVMVFRKLVVLEKGPGYRTGSYLEMGKGCRRRDRQPQHRYRKLALQ